MAGDPEAYKVCPRCNVAAYLSAPTCSHCGHLFQTQFTQPPNQTQAFYGQANPNWNPGQPYPGPYGRPDSNRLLIAILLWFFLGHFGAHRFYLGHINTAIVMLVLEFVGLATICLLVGYFFILAVAVWWIVDLVQMLTGNLTFVDGTRLV